MNTEVRRLPGWSYEKLDQRQREIARAISADPAAPGALLLSEVEPVITMGRRACPQDLLLPKEALRARGISVYPTDRGGFATYHGPGQWVLFAVDRLDRLTGDRRGVRAAVEALLGGALDLARQSVPEAEIREGPLTGVWTPRGKLASVGVYVQDGILLHGLSVNVFPTETSFVGLRPCGLDAAVDYLWSNKPVSASKTQDDAEFCAVGERLVSAVKRRFDELTGTRP